MAKGDLTKRQRLFVAEYLVDLNATQAAIRAGYNLLESSAGGFYVYFLCDPETGNIFYVGKGRAGRLHTHVKAARKPSITDNNAKNKKIHEITGKGLTVQELVFADEMSEPDAFALERVLISQLKTYGLTNIASGVVTSEESAMLFTQGLLEKLKRFEQWETGLTEEKRAQIERVFGDLESFYEKVKTSLESLSLGSADSVVVVEARR